MKKKEITFALVLITMAVLTRTTFHIGDNIEFITAIGLCTGYFFTNKKLSIMTVLFGLIVSDIIIGNTSIFLFTWSGFIIPVIIGKLLTKLKTSYLTRLITIQAGGFAATTFFYLWTNFGVVLVTTMYTKTIAGLANSYVNALPFYKTQLGANLIIAPLMFIGFTIIYKFILSSNLSKKMKLLNFT